MLKYSSKEECLNELTKKGVPFIRHDHPAVFTIEDMKTHIKFQHAPFIKNLFYADKKGRFFMVVALHDTKVSKAFWKKVGTTPGNVRLAKEEHLEKVLGVKKGRVSPFALANDAEKVVKLIVDEKLKEVEYWSFHPLCNETTI